MQTYDIRWTLGASFPSTNSHPETRMSGIWAAPKKNVKYPSRDMQTYLLVLKGEQTSRMHSCLCLCVYALAHERFLDDRSPSRTLLHPCSVLWRILDEDGSIALHACKTKTGCTAGYAKNAMRLPWDRLLLVGEQHSGPIAYPWLGR